MNRRANRALPMLFCRVVALGIASLFMVGSTAAKQAQRVGTLDNGLNYAVVSDTSSPLVRSSLFVNKGTDDERSDQIGMAHLLEHILVSRDTRYFGAPVHVIGDQQGIPRASTRAITTEGYVEYQYEAPASVWVKNSLDRLRLLRGIAGGVDLTDEILKLEIGPVLEEWSRAVAEDGGEIEEFQERSRAELTDAMFAEESCRKRYRKVEIADIERSMASIRVAMLSDAQDNWYRPENMTLVVVGPIDVVEIERQIAALFSDVRPREVSSAATKAPICHVQNSVGRLVSQLDSQNRLISINFIGQPSKARDIKSYVKDTVVEQVAFEILKARLDYLSENSDEFSGSIHVNRVLGYYNSDIRSIKFGFVPLGEVRKVDAMRAIWLAIISLQDNPPQPDELVEAKFKVANLWAMQALERHDLFRLTQLGFGANAADWRGFRSRALQSVASRDISAFARANLRSDSVQIQSFGGSALAQRDIDAVWAPVQKQNGKLAPEFRLSPTRFPRTNFRSSSKYSLQENREIGVSQLRRDRELISVAFKRIDNVNNIQIGYEIPIRPGKNARAEILKVIDQVRSTGFGGLSSDELEKFRDRNAIGFSVQPFEKEISFRLFAPRTSIRAAYRYLSELLNDPRIATRIRPLECGTAMTIVGDVGEEVIADPSLTSLWDSFPSGCSMSGAGDFDRNTELNRAEHEEAGSVNKVVISFPVSDAQLADPRYKILAETAYRRLWKALRQERGSVYAVFVEMREFPSAMFVAEFETRRDDEVEPLMSAAIHQMIDLFRNGPSKEEFRESLSAYAETIETERSGADYWTASLAESMRNGQGIADLVDPILVAPTFEEVRDASSSILKAGMKVYITDRAK